MILYIVSVILIIIIIIIAVGLYFLNKWIFESVLNFIRTGNFPWSNFVFDHYLAFFKYFRMVQTIPKEEREAKEKDIEYFRKIFKDSAEAVPKFYPKLSEYDKKTIKGLYGAITEILIAWSLEPKSEDFRRKFETTMDALKNFISIREMENYDGAVFEEYKGIFVNVRDPGEVHSTLIHVSKMIEDLQNSPIDFPVF